MFDGRSVLEFCCFAGDIIAADRIISLQPMAIGLLIEKIAPFTDPHDSLLTFKGKVDSVIFVVPDRLIAVIDAEFKKTGTNPEIQIGSPCCEGISGEKSVGE